MLHDKINCIKGGDDVEVNRSTKGCQAYVSNIPILGLVVKGCLDYERMEMLSRPGMIYMSYQTGLLSSAQLKAHHGFKYNL